jgi:hypothetical protein
LEFELKRLEVAREFFMTSFLFGLLVWIYAIAIQITEPKVLRGALTHVDVFPLNIRLDIAGMVAFAISALSFFLWRLTTGSSKAK